MQVYNLNEIYTTIIDKVANVLYSESSSVAPWCSPGMINASMR